DLLDAFVLPLVHKRVIGAAPGANIFRGFDKLIRPEVDLPVFLSSSLRNALRFAGQQAFAFFLVRKFHPESVGLAFGRESNQRLLRIVLFEVPHLPRVWREESLFEDASELRLAAAFELDEV